MRLLLSLTLVMFAAVVAAAQAGVYDVRLCGAGTADSAWAGTSTTPAIALTQQCSPSPGAEVSGIAVSDALRMSTPVGATASWAIRAPEGTIIRRLDANRSISNRPGWESAILTAEGTALETCPLFTGQFRCNRGAPAGGDNAVSYGGLATSAVVLRLTCVASCGNGISEHRVWVSLYGGTVRIEDPVLPTVSRMSGSFADAGWHKGADTVTASATDSSGIKQLRLVAGDVELGRKDGVCDYTRMQPCEGSLAGTFSFDTAKLPDGTHELKVVAVDAADQPGVMSGTLRVDRHAPAAPTDLSVTAADDGSYDVKWVNPAQGSASPVVAAHYAICDPAPALTCQPAQRVAGADIAKLTDVKASGKGSFRLWLEDEAGNVDPGNSSVAPVDPALRTNPRVLDTNPPILLPSGPAPASKLKIGKARRSGSTLTVSGTIARGASARISARLARTRTGKVAATGRTNPRRGTWSLKIKLPPSLRNAKALYLTVTFSGQDNFRKTTLKRKLSRRGGSSGSSTSSEFSVETGR